MISMRIGDLAQAVGGRVLPAKMADAYVRSVVTDSRGVLLGALFVPIVGERVDGHDYIEQAFDAGAVASLIDEEKLERHADRIPFGKALIAVPHTETALEQAAACYRSQFPVPAVGITGSVGKTTCKNFVAAALSGGRKVLKTEGNHNNNIGMPLTLFDMDEKTELLVLEMGMDHFGEIHRLSETARPRISIITNIGISHMENLGSREGILKAKLEIADGLEPDGLLLLNGDDPMLNTLKETRSEQIEYFGYGEKNDGRILKAEMTEAGHLFFEGTYDGEIYQIELNTPGRRMAINVMPAIIAAVRLGLHKDEILKGLASYTPEHGRLEVRKGHALTVIDDSYNASPDSMKAGIDALVDYPSGGRRIAVLGDMYELGAAEEEGHREVGRYLAAHADTVNRVWTVGEKAVWIGEELASSGIQVSHAENVETLISGILKDRKQGDVYLVKASNGMKLSQAADVLLS